MRRDHVRAVFDATKVGEVFTTRDLANKLELPWRTISGAIKFLHGLCIEIYEDKPKKPRKWIRTIPDKGKLLTSYRRV